MATMKKPKIEKGEEEATAAAEANTNSTLIPDDKESLLEFMDQRAKSIQNLKEQISTLERKLVEERKVMADAEAKFIVIDRVEKNTVSKTNTNVPGKTGSLLGLAEFWTEGNKVRTANETSIPRPCKEMESSTMPSIILPPSFKRKASAPVRPEENGTAKAQPMATRDYNVPKEDSSGSEAKRSRSSSVEVVRETLGRSYQNQAPARDNHTQDQGRDNQTQIQARDNQTQTQARDNQTQTQARDSHTNKDFAKPKIRVSPKISRQGQMEKSEFQEHDELIALIGRSSLRATIDSRTVDMLPCRHTKRMRSLALSPSNRELFATSALDGVVHFWKLQSDRSSATLFKTVNRVGEDQRKWAEDIAWHPYKSALFSVYTADEGHPQISALYLNESRGNCESKFMKDRPHTKGLINRVVFMPWEDPCFITAGCDHAVVLWREQREKNEWKSTLMHRDLHTSAVMGVAGLRDNNLVLSCGEDRRFVGFDAREEKVTFRHRLDSRCTSLLPNPRDANLVMVSTRQLDRQLRLYDVRIPQTELFSFGWKQQSSESQSALINQSWSPDGLHISTGSVDPVIHIFDIRYNAPTPSLSIKAHKKRVFKAEWHSSRQLLVSISSDLEIGIHKLW